MKQLILLFLIIISSISYAVYSTEKPAELKRLEEKLTHAFGKWEETVIAASELLEYDPTQTEIYFEKAEALWQLGRYEEALEEFNLAIKYDYANKGLCCLGQVYYYMGICFEELGRLEEALEYYEKGVENGIDHRYIHFAIIHTKIELDKLGKYSFKEDRFIDQP